MGRLLIAFVTALALVFHHSFSVPSFALPLDAQPVGGVRSVRSETKVAARSPHRGSAELRATIASLPQARPQEPSGRIHARPGSAPAKRVLASRATVHRVRSAAVAFSDIS